VFYAGDNKITEQVYFESIHKKEGEDGSYEEISTDLVNDPSDKNEVETENANLHSAFRKKMKNGRYATFSIDGHSVTYSILEASQNGDSPLKPKDVNR
jgi:hypothetical protein